MPGDPDVRPFHFRFLPDNHPRPIKKRHHYLSETYINGFAGDGGRVWAYRAEEPERPALSRPNAVGFRNYYYSQALPTGGKEHHRFEELWGAIETVWPDTLRAVVSKELSEAISFNVLGMATVLRARVPAARERNELLMAAKLRTDAQRLEEAGALPEGLERYAGQLDHVPVGINPEQTIGTMMDDMRAFGDLCFKLGFEVLHNRTSTPFITTDNPVCFYDPEVPRHLRRPYEYRKELELIFPLDAWRLLRGSTRLAPVNSIIRHRGLSDPAGVRQMNRTIAQFGYGLYIARDRSADELVRRYAGLCPTVEPYVFEGERSFFVYGAHIFGPRPVLSPFIDTPEKAARLETMMAHDAESSLRASRVPRTE